MIRTALFALTLLAGPALAEDRQTAIFAGGCFWCTESDFDKVPGVLETVSGYIGGTVEAPTYRQVVSGGTGHLEAVAITYDADVVDYATLLQLYWRSIDPLDAGGQFCDRGESYTTAIFAETEAERRLAEASKAESAEILGAPIATTIRDAAPFWPAEEYHQDYYRKNPIRYSFYRSRCGRDARVRAVWGEAAAFADASH